jgi:hypothetical protein
VQHRDRHRRCLGPLPRSRVHGDGGGGGSRRARKDERGAARCLVSSFFIRKQKKKRGASRTEAISFGLLPILVWALIWKFCCGLCVRDGLWHKFCLIIASAILVLHKKSITAEASSIAVISNGSPSP